MSDTNGNSENLTAALEKVAAKMRAGALLTPEEAAKFLSMSRSSVLRLISDGNLPAVCLKSGRRKKTLRVRPEQLQRWLNVKEREGMKREA